MELDEFIDHLSDRPLTEQEKALMDEMRAMVSDKPFKVLVVDGHLPASLVDRFFGVAGMDFNKIEERVLANIVKDRDTNRQLEKAIIFGTRYSYGWFDEFQGIQTKDMSHHEMGIVNSTRFVPHTDKPADHPERKREPKGPRGKWGKLK